MRRLGGFAIVIAAALWMSPAAAKDGQPQAAYLLIEAASGAITEEWIDRLLLDFVEKALSQA